MAPYGLRATICALVLVLLPGSLLAGDPGDPMADRVAVQKALQLGRDLLARRSYEAAVQALEAQLERVNGSREYLSTLRDAYREYVRELRLAHREADAQVYLRRLQILDPGCALDNATTRTAAAPSPPAAAALDSSKPGPIARAAMGEEPGKDLSARRREVQALLAQANESFDQKQFEAAARLFEKANLADAPTAATSHERWAYCRLYQVVKRLNQENLEGPAIAEMANEVRLALSLAPNNTGLKGWGTQVLDRIQERASGKGIASASRETELAPQVSVHHAEKPYRGWNVAETTNFRIFHNQPREMVEQVARVAEKTRLDVERKYFGGGIENWKPVCEIVLYPTAEEYSRQTNFPANYPGHSKIESSNGRVVSRRIQLHCDEHNMLVSVLPHETTHVVLADKFGGKPLPRWADEGMAVQSEPREHIEKHLRNLPQHRQDRQLFTLRQLMQMDEYPDTKYIGAFYAESVSLVDFLSQKRGPQTFAQFVQDGLNGGFEKALRQHYHVADFDELQQQWLAHVFNDAVSAGKLAESGR